MFKRNKTVGPKQKEMNVIKRMQKTKFVAGLTFACSGHLFQLRNSFEYGSGGKRQDRLPDSNHAIVTHQRGHSSLSIQFASN
jgi:hypothetical protein